MNDKVHQINIETLTPVHIGNGVFLLKESDFVSGKEDEKDYNYIVDVRKVLDLIGLEHLNDWMAVIERHTQDTTNFIRQYKKDVQLIEFAKRKILSLSSVNPDETLKECLHDGRGLPYIPGSSIKGAIRTAIVANMVAKSNLSNLAKKVVYGKEISADWVEKDFFGKNVRDDLFRFLQIGDAYFPKDSEISIRMENLNIREKSIKLRDKSKSQLVEAIDSKKQSCFQLKLSNQLYQWAKQHYDGFKALPASMDSCQDLFKMLNSHTKKLVENEIGYWEKKSETHDDAEDYINTMKDLCKKIEACREGEECILRIGHGSGWTFITGAWAKKLDNFADIVDKARPNNENYKKYDFPKSRRLDEKSGVLGFVKLSYIN